MKDKSREFKIIIFFLIAQVVVAWIVQFLYPMEGRFLVHETFLALVAVCIGVNWLLRLARTRKLEKPDGFQLVLLILVLLAALSTIAGLDPWSSLTGRDRRYEGLYSLAAYYMLCATAAKLKDRKEKKIVFSVFMIIGNINALVGILAGLNLIPLSINTWPDIAAIPYANPNFYGSMICMVDAVCMGLIIYAKGKGQRIYAGISLVLAELATWSCSSSSTMVGNIMVFLIIILMETVIRIRYKNRSLYKQRLLALAACLAVYILTAFAVNTIRPGSVVGEIYHNTQIIYMAEETETPILYDNMFSGRMGIWKYCFERIPEYWYLGIGPDNLWVITTLEEGAPEAAYAFDKAHNEYINIMISEGIPALIVYLVFLFMLFIPGLKEWKERGEAKPVILAGFLAYFAYIAQAFFNISVIQVAPFFWIICGLVASDRGEKFCT